MSGTLSSPLYIDSEDDDSDEGGGKTAEKAREQSVLKEGAVLPLKVIKTPIHR